jgi:hypothetical protein
VPVARKGGVHVNRVRHHGGAEHAGGQQHRSHAVEPRHEPAENGTAVRRTDHEAREEADRDDGEQAHDHAFEGPLPESALQCEQPHRHRADDHAAEEQREVEQQLQGDRAAEHLGQVGGEGDQLRLRPERDAAAAPHPVPQQFGQGAARDDAELRGLVLHQCGHHVRHDEHPDQQVAVPCAAGEVGGDIAGIDVGDGGDEGRAE